MAKIKKVAVTMTREEREAALQNDTHEPIWPKHRIEVWLPQDKLFEDLHHTIPVGSPVAVAEGGSTELDLSNWKLGDDDLQTVAEHCTDITSLKLALCAEITDAGIENLVGFHHVTHLDLRGCFQLTDRSLNHIRSSFPKLEHLDGRDCHNLGEDGIRDLVVSTRHLHTLLVSVVTR